MCWRRKLKRTQNAEGEVFCWIQVILWCCPCCSASCNIEVNNRTGFVFWHSIPILVYWAVWKMKSYLVLHLDLNVQLCVLQGDTHDLFFKHFGGLSNMISKYTCVSGNTWHLSQTKRMLCLQNLWTQFLFWPHCFCINLGKSLKGVLVCRILLIDVWRHAVLLSYIRILNTDFVFFLQAFIGTWAGTWGAVIHD